MALQNQCVFCYTGNEKGWDEMYPDICYASLWRFYDAVKMKLPRDWVLSAFRLDKKEIEPSRANWWVANVLQHVHPDTRQGFRITRVGSKVAFIIKNYYADGTPWIKVKLKGDLLSTSEIYAILVMLRYPQERPEIVNDAYWLVHDLGVSFSTAYLIAGSQNQHSGHGFLTECVWAGVQKFDKDELKKIVLSYSLKDVFLKVRADFIDRGSYKKNPQKNDVTCMFLPQKMGIHGWGSGIKGPLPKSEGLKWHQKVQYWVNYLELKGVEQK